MPSKAKINKIEEAEVVRRSVFAVQVCVPKKWTKKQIEDFANSAYPTGLDARWYVIGKDEARGEPLRVPCSKEEREGFVHVVLNY